MTIQDLSVLARKLNDEMRCPAGKNQVYVHPATKRNGRIKAESVYVCLDCKIKNFLGEKPKRVRADYIKIVCCGDHKRQCSSYTKFMTRGRFPYMQP